MKKATFIIYFFSMLFLKINAQCNLDFGDNTVFNFSAGDIVANTTTATDRTHTQSFDVWNTSGSGDCSTTDGTDDITIQMDIIETFDAYGGTHLNTHVGTTHDIQQNTSTDSGADGLRGSIPLGGSSGKLSSPGDVRGYKITVEFANDIIIKADRVTVEYSSINTRGKAFESTLISFLDENGNPFSTTPTYNGYYDAGPVESSVCNTTPTVNANPWSSPLGTGHFSAHATSTVDITNTCITSGDTNGPDDTGSLLATTTGIAGSTRIGGFIFMVYLEDVASATTEDQATSTSTTFTSTLKGMTITGNTPLPIELVSFAANQKEETVALNWITASEENNDFFTVETSKDGINFSSLAEIKGAGSSIETKHYQYTHYNPEVGVNYYRIKQTDFDGQFGYSQTKVVIVTSSKAIKIFPTLVTDKINLEAEDGLKQNTTIEIFNLNGLLIKQMSLSSKQYSFELDLHDLPNGTYYISYKNAWDSGTQRFIKI